MADENEAPENEDLDGEGAADRDLSSDEGDVKRGEVSDLPEWAQKIIHSLRDENKKRRVAFDELAKRAESMKSVDEVNELIAAEKAEQDKLRLEVARRDVMREFDVPDGLSEFVAGDTPEDMRKRAEALMTVMGERGKSRPVERRGGGVNGADTAGDGLPDDPRKLAEMVPRLS